MAIGWGLAKSLLGSTSVDLLEAPDAERPQLADPGRRPDPQVVEAEGAIRRDLEPGRDGVVVDLLDRERRDPGLVEDDLQGVAQPGAREGDVQLGPALAADRDGRRSGSAWRPGRPRSERKVRAVPRRAGRMEGSRISGRVSRFSANEIRPAPQVRRGRAGVSHAVPITVRRRSSGQQFLEDLAAVDDLDRPVARRHQFLVGDDAELVVDGRGEVFGADRVAFGLGGRGVGGAVDIARP